MNWFVIKKKFSSAYIYICIDIQKGEENILQALARNICDLWLHFPTIYTLPFTQPKETPLFHCSITICSRTKEVVPRISLFVFSLAKLLVLINIWFHIRPIRKDPKCHWQQLLRSRVWISRRTTVITLNNLILVITCEFLLLFLLLFLRAYTYIGACKEQPRFVSMYLKPMAESMTSHCNSAATC